MYVDELKAGKGVKMVLHTETKHKILRRYLIRWINILGQHNKELAYIDGFAGKGRDDEGNPGSPLIALQAAESSTKKIDSPTVHFWFIEKSRKEADSLFKEIDEFRAKQSGRIEIHGVKRAEFELGFRDIVKELETNHGKPPAFMFVDPYGYLQVKMDTLVRFLQSPKREVLVTFMDGFMNRFVNEAKYHKKLDEAFGTTKWRDCIKSSRKDRMDCLRQMYIRQLENDRVKCLPPFNMKNITNNHIYSLIFATGNKRGLKTMKEEMTKIDKNFQLEVSDRDDIAQTTLFPYGYTWQAEAANMVYDKFHGQQSIPIDVIDDFVTKSTKHRFQITILKILEADDPPRITKVETPGTERWGKSYPPGCRISFSKKRHTSSASH